MIGVDGRVDTDDSRTFHLGGLWCVKRGCSSEIGITRSSSGFRRLIADWSFIIALKDRIEKLETQWALSPKYSQGCGRNWQTHKQGTTDARHDGAAEGLSSSMTLNRK